LEKNEIEIRKLFVEMGKYCQTPELLRLEIFWKINLGHSRKALEHVLETVSFNSDVIKNCLKYLPINC